MNFPKGINKGNIIIIIIVRHFMINKFRFPYPFPYTMCFLFSEHIVWSVNDPGEKVLSSVVVWFFLVFLRLTGAHSSLQAHCSVFELEATQPGTLSSLMSTAVHFVLTCRSSGGS